jgi:hypothetical protein
VATPPGSTVGGGTAGDPPAEMTGAQATPDGPTVSVTIELVEAVPLAALVITVVVTAVNVVSSLTVVGVNVAVTGWPEMVPVTIVDNPVVVCCGLPVAVPDSWEAPSPVPVEPGAAVFDPVNCDAPEPVLDGRADPDAGPVTGTVVATQPLLGPLVGIAKAVGGVVDQGQRPSQNMEYDMLSLHVQYDSPDGPAWGSWNGKQKGLGTEDVPWALTMPAEANATAASK